MTPLADLIESLGLTSVWTYVGVFLAVSLLMMWRLEAMLDHGLEGTALGTILMPYCSGLGNLIFVGVVVAHGGPSQDILTNSLVNNVTNLTLILGVPAVLWGLAVMPSSKTARAGRRSRSKSGGADVEPQIHRLSILLTLAAVLFFTGAAWVLAEKGRLDRQDGLILIGLFVFWQCFQTYDVLKHNVRRKASFGALFYIDVGIVLLSAYGMYASIDWLVSWVPQQHGAFVNAGHLGWLSGWLMVLPNALIAFYWGWKRRADIVYTSQIGDGHICIPLGLGICALFAPVNVPGFFVTGLMILLGAAVAQAVFLLAFGGLPRWAGWIFIAGYGCFLYLGLGA